MEGIPSINPIEGGGVRLPEWLANLAQQRIEWAVEALDILQGYPDAVDKILRKRETSLSCDVRGKLAGSMGAFLREENRNHLRRGGKKQYWPGARSPRLDNLSIGRHLYKAVQ